MSAGSYVPYGDQAAVTEQVEAIVTPEKAEALVRYQDAVALQSRVQSTYDSLVETLGVEGAADALRQAAANVAVAKQAYEATV